MTNSIGWLLSFVFLLSFLGSVSGWLYWRSTQGIAFGIMGGILLALWVGINKLTRFIYPDSFVEYAEDEKQIVQKVTLVINIEGIGRKLIHGLDMEEIQSIGQCVTHNNAYKFSVQHFKDYFKTTDIDGYSLYSKSVRWMKDVGALAPNAQGGVDVTEIGERVFNAMRDKDWQVIEDLPYPAV